MLALKTATQHSRLGCAAGRSFHHCRTAKQRTTQPPAAPGTRLSRTHAAPPVMDLPPQQTSPYSPPPDPTSSAFSPAPPPFATTGRLHLIMGPMFAGKTTELLQRVVAEEGAQRRVAVINSRKDTRYGENLCASHDGVRRAAHSVDCLWDLLRPAHAPSNPTNTPEHSRQTGAARADPSGAHADCSQSAAGNPNADGSSRSPSIGAAEPGARAAHSGNSDGAAASGGEHTEGALPRAAEIAENGALLPNGSAAPTRALPPMLDLSAVDVIAIDEAQFFPDLKAFCVHMVEVEGKDVIAAGLSGDFRRDTFGEIVSLVPLADEVTLRTARCTYCQRDAAFTLRLSASEEQQLVGGADSYQPVCRSHYVSLSQCRHPL